MTSRRLPPSTNARAQEAFAENRQRITALEDAFAVRDFYVTICCVMLFAGGRLGGARCKGPVV
jgi:hypothetical protein